MTILSKRRFDLLFSIGLALVGLVVIWSGLPSMAGAADEAPPAGDARSVAPAEASLHNPNFDNNDWYEFGGVKGRYQKAYPEGVWLPDDDNNNYNTIPSSILQDWRLWFLDGTSVVHIDPSGSDDPRHTLPKAVLARPFGGDPKNHQLAGLYQVVYNPTPCMLYEFQMYGQSFPRSGTPPAALKVGIDRVGWHPDSANDPAVHGDFPSTTVWGEAHDYKFVYGLLSVSAEAWSQDSIVVYTYADAPGTSSHHIFWDTGSLQEVAPDPLHDPNDLPAAGGILNPTVAPGTNSATISWQTADKSLGQVYYRLVPQPSEPITPTGTINYFIYLPFVQGQRAVEWQRSAVDEAYSTQHQVILDGLSRGRDYEYVIVSRGLSNERCVTWATDVGEFTTDD